MDLDDGGEQVGPNAVEVVLDNSPDISRKGKRKMIILRIQRAKGVSKKPV